MHSNIPFIGLTTFILIYSILILAKNGNMQNDIKISIKFNVILWKKTKNSYSNEVNLKIKFYVKFEDLKVTNFMTSGKFKKKCVLGNFGTKT